MQMHATPLKLKRRIGMVVADFDDTCTQGDTIGILMEACINAATLRASPAAAEAVRAERETAVRALVAHYGASADRVLSLLLQRLNADNPDGDSVAAAAVHRLLSSLHTFDAHMNTLVAHSGVLQGATEEDMRAAAARTTLQPGCGATLAALQGAGVPLRILSANWSATLVRASLGRGGVDASEGALGAIYANELEFDASTGVSTGNIVHRVKGPLDKKTGFMELLSSEKRQVGDTVYLGDSITDLPALMAADYGIVIRQSKKLRDILQAAGIAIAPLGGAPMRSRGPASVTGVLYTAEWSDVHTFLFGPEARDTLPASALVRAAAVPSGWSSNASHVSGAYTADRLPAPATPPRVMSVAGSDSGGGAGIQADLKTFMGLGAFGMTTLTSVTAQNTQGVQGVHVVPPTDVAAQLDSVLGDLGVDALKTGMLPTPECITAVAAKLREYQVSNIVVDPVMVSTSGATLAKSECMPLLRDVLFPLATVVTPNTTEASALLDDFPIASVADMEEAARRLHRLGPLYVMVKGGHLVGSGSSGGGSGDAVDVLFDGVTMLHLTVPAVATKHTHGTGCTLASAIAVALAQGRSPPDAVKYAKDYVTTLLRASATVSLGSGSQKPMQHAALVAPVTAAAATAAPTRSTAAATAPVTHTRNPCDLRCYVVTDAACNAKAGRSMVDAVRAAVEGGATIVQLREKDLDAAAYVQLARDVLEVTRPAGVPLLINDRVDVALAAGADGAHVGQTDLPAAAVRAMLGPTALLGVSVKTPQQAADAAAAGADYVGAGAVFPTGTKADASVIGLDGLRAVCAASSEGALGPMPVVAIGGVSAANAAQAVAAGAAGAAVVSDVFAAACATAAAQQLRRVVDDTLDSSGAR